MAEKNLLKQLETALGEDKQQDSPLTKTLKEKLVVLKELNLYALEKGLIELANIAKEEIKETQKEIEEQQVKRINSLEKKIEQILKS